ncbi:MAG: ribosomal-processing cysteine protease Prp [Bacilli bacterium]|nr:ribosomal-processing cysteine protease Prp [Bacilli bacterium]
MIKVTVTSKNNKFHSIKCSGHANHGKYGQDIVCAAVSGIVPGGFEALRDGENNYSVVVEDGYVMLTSLNDMSEHDLTVIETITAQIEGIARSYPDNVSLERKNDK